MPKKKVKKSRVFIAVALTVGVIFGTDIMRRDFFSDYDDTIEVSGEFKDSNAPAPTLSGDPSKLNGGVQINTQDLAYMGYKQIQLTAADLASGLLAVYPNNGAAPSADPASLVSLSSVKNEYYSLRSDDIMLNSQAATDLNALMAAYNKATGLSDCMVYAGSQQYLEPESFCPDAFAESSSGLTVDLAIQGIYNTLEYDGADEEAWVINNCANYGFVVRYPSDKIGVTGQAGCKWHLRYVGGVHSAVMQQYNFCLEEYVQYLKSYTLETTPLSFNLDGMNYEIYYVPSMGETTTISVPVSGDYSISGNNMDGFIVTAIK